MDRAPQFSIYILTSLHPSKSGSLPALSIEYTYSLTQKKALVPKNEAPFSYHFHQTGVSLLDREFLR